jgi:hypothetical protein
MVCFQTKNPNLGNFWGVALEDVGIFVDTWSILRSFVIFNGHFGIARGNLVYFSRFGILYQEESGNPEPFWRNVAQLHFEFR